MSDNKAKNKSKILSIDIINLYKYLTDNKNEYIMSKQLLRSGTSIGANLAESECASSKKDFLNKLYIALKECNETIYWIDLLKETKYIDADTFNSINSKCEEIKRMLSASTKTIQEQLKEKEI
ncbi:MAG: four helix bundle protein [Eubacterium sp.]|nr:four helix bundle protein [Eubacterium sp.]